VLPVSCRCCIHDDAEYDDDEDELEQQVEQSHSTPAQSRTDTWHTKEEFNVNWKAECDQFNLAHVARNKISIRKKLKQTNASAPVIQKRLRSMKAVRKTSEWLWRKWVVKEMSFKSEVKDRGSDRWWQTDSKVKKNSKWQQYDNYSQVSQVAFIKPMFIALDCT